MRISQLVVTKFRSKHKKMQFGVITFPKTYSMENCNLAIFTLKVSPMIH